MQSFSTNFNPMLQGFKFRNRFELPTSIRFNIPSITRAPLTSSDVVYGLCGGMCFAALDYFYEHLPIPGVTEVDDINLKLFTYLWGRQLDSLSRNILLKLFQYMIISDRSLNRSIEQIEAPLLRQKLSLGEPVVLALVRIRGLSDPTRNHQVTAISCDYDPISKGMTVQLYDPNWPDRVPELSFSLAKPSKGINLTQSTGEVLRGFFVIPYTQQIPPSG